MTMKQFSQADVANLDSMFPRIYVDRSELVYDPPAWMKAGRLQTASGYGSRLNSGLKIHFEGKLRRIYVTCYGTAGSSWFIVKGRKIYVE